MDFNLGHRSLFAPPIPSTGRYRPFDFDEAATAQGQNVADQMGNQPNLMDPEPKAPTDRLSDLYSKITAQEPGPAQKRYHEFLNTEEPDRADFKPTKMNRLGAILAGVSEGINRGGGAGYGTARSILDEPYQQEMARYTSQGKKLSDAANLEEKDITNRVSTYAKILQDERDQRNFEQRKKVDDARIRNYESQAANRGFHYEKVTDPHTGKTSSVKIGPDGKTTNVDLGIGAFTPDEKITQSAKEAGAKAKATEGSRMKVAAAGAAARADASIKVQSAKFKNITDLLEWKKKNLQSYTFKEDKDGGIIAVNKADPMDQVDTGLNSGKMNDKDKMTLQNELGIKLKAAPAADKTTETTHVDKDGKESTTKTTVKAGAAAAKIKVFAPDGTPGSIDVSELEEALKHGYRKR